MRINRRLVILALAVLVPAAIAVAWLALFGEPNTFLAKVGAVKTGMSESEVQSILGAPNLSTPLYLTEGSQSGLIRKLIEKYGAGSRLILWSYRDITASRRVYVGIQFLANPEAEWRVVESNANVIKNPLSERLWRTLPPALRW